MTVVVVGGGVWHAIKLRRKALVAGSKAIESLSEAGRAFAQISGSR